MAESTSPLTMAADVMVMAAPTDATQTPADGPIPTLAALGINVIAVVVRVSKLHAALLVSFANDDSGVGQTSDRGHAWGPRVVTTAPVGLLIGWVGLVDEGGIRVGRVGLIHCVGHLLLEHICF